MPYKYLVANMNESQTKKKKEKPLLNFAASKSGLPNPQFV